mmetsp:Transcript_101178/g.163225  ORF Transcript_101178/g.163225 Transcript_101178/m.163225 type:complete len:208 (-) Transcript_101178:549-1172(-)
MLCNLNTLQLACFAPYILCSSHILCSSSSSSSSLGQYTTPFTIQSWTMLRKGDEVERRGLRRSAVRMWQPHSTAAPSCRPLKLSGALASSSHTCPSAHTARPLARRSQATLVPSERVKESSRPSARSAIIISASSASQDRALWCRLEARCRFCVRYPPSHRVKCGGGGVSSAHPSIVWATSLHMRLTACSLIRPASPCWLRKEEGSV